MLVMRRRAGEAIFVGKDVEIRILGIGRTKVKLGITAPREISVVAREVELVQQENQAAAHAAPEHVSTVFARLLGRQVGSESLAEGHPILEDRAAVTKMPQTADE